MKGLNPPFLTVFPSIAIYPLLRLIFWNLTTRCLAVTGGGSVGECNRLSQSTCLLDALYNIVLLTYLVTYRHYASTFNHRQRLQSPPKKTKPLMGTKPRVVAPITTIQLFFLECHAQACKKETDIMSYVRVGKFFTHSSVLHIGLRTKREC